MRTAAQASGPLAEVVTAERLDGAAWDRLAAESGSPHPHYARHVVAAHMAAGYAPANLRVLIVRAGTALLAALPFTLRRDVSALGGLVARPFLSPLVTATSPLVVGGAERPAALRALVDGLAIASDSRAWRWPLLPFGGPDGEALRAALAEAGWQQACVASFERPVLDRAESHAAFLAAHPNRSRLKDLRRRERRLAERGSVTLETATEGPDLAAAVEAFLTLEQAGWKGEAGTAMACRPASAALARALFAPERGPVSARADTLCVDGRPIAVSLALVCGGSATLLKTAYDEGARALAPGLVLEAEIIRAMHDTGFAHRLDSATLAGSALESLYPGRETIGEIIAVPPGGSALSLDRRVRLARFEHRARAEAKAVLQRR
ncbi:GNAT family N-acetyltransferase [Methylobacterium sp. A54F]